MGLMRLILAWPVSWLLFWLGHVVGLIMLIPGLHVLYAIYNRCMLASFWVQNWGTGPGPWIRNIIEHE
jgi:hypothetical protein